MADDLTDTYERIKWCRSKTTVLAAEIDLFILKGGVHEISHDVDDEGTATFFVRLIKPPPRAFSIETGAIVHELRASLDGLACVLAQRNGRGTKNVYFPISKDLAVFEADGLKNKLRNLSQADKDLIAALKPYGGGNPMLFALHAADLVPKHQRVILTHSGLSSIGIRSGKIGKLEMIGPGPITSEKRAFVRLSKDTTVDMDLGVDLSFSEPDEIKGRSVIAALNDFSGLVQSIVDLFN